MACEESQQLRRALMTVALNKKSEKINQKLQHQIDVAVKEWERIIFDYINVTKEVCALTKTAEQQHKLTNLRAQLKQYADLIKLSTQHFDSLWKMIDVMLPVAAVAPEWMDNIIKQEQKLSQMKETLVPLLVFSSNREVIETVQKMMLHINEIQTKISILAGRLRDGMEDTLKYGSNVIINRNATGMVDDDDDDDNDAVDSDEEVALKGQEKNN